MNFRISALLAMAIAVIVVFAACTGYSGTELKLPGHEDRVYEFSYDVKETLQIPVNNAFAVKQLMDNNNVYTFVFDGSNEMDNGRFRVSIINIVTKLKLYYKDNKTLGSQNFPVYYFLYVNDTREWHDSSEQIVRAPVFSGPVVWFKGPNTGADATAVTVNGNIIYITGKTGRDVERAADRFVLAVFGVNE